VDSTPYTFDRKGVDRIIRAVRAVEGVGSLTGAGVAKYNPGNQCIVAKLNAQGTAKHLYGWTQQQFSGLDWADLPNGLTGTPTQNPAIDPTLDPDSDLLTTVTGAVVLVRSAAADGLCWVIAGGVGGTDCTSADSTSLDVVTSVTWDGATGKLQYSKSTLTIDGCGNASYGTPVTVDIDTAGACS
jgi:hypothetical protein